MTMQLRASICALVDNAGEVELAEGWLRDNESSLTYVSEMNGCGCCVFMWDIEGPADVVKTLPSVLSAGSDWVSSGPTDKA